VRGALSNASRKIWPGRSKIGFLTSIAAESRAPVPRHRRRVRRRVMKPQPTRLHRSTSSSAAAAGRPKVAGCFSEGSRGRFFRRSRGVSPKVAESRWVHSSGRSRKLTIRLGNMDALHDVCLPGTATFGSASAAAMTKGAAESGGTATVPTAAGPMIWTAIVTLSAINNSGLRLGPGIAGDQRGGTQGLSRGHHLLRQMRHHRRAQAGERFHPRLRGAPRLRPGSCPGGASARSAPAMALASS